MKVCPMGSELFLADGRKDEQTDMKKITVDFRNFADAPENPQINN